MLRTALHSVELRARNFLLLERAEQAVRAMTADQHRAVQRYYQAALRRAVVADELTQSHNAVAALLLYREAAHLLIKAVVVSRDPAADLDALTVPAAWEALQELVAARRVPRLPAPVNEARQALSQTELLSFDDDSPEELLRKRTAAEGALRWLRTLVEPRTLRQVRVSRAGRIALTALLVVGAIIWAVSGMVRTPNLARRRPVTISERQPNSTAPVDNSGLVNGEIESTYGIHTTTRAPWVMVDLQSVHAISKVKIYNRADGWQDAGLPFILELSEDGSSFKEVDRRTQGFTASRPWVFNAGGRRARYVRIRSEKYIALAEIEVYGR